MKQLPLFYANRQKGATTHDETLIRINQVAQIIEQNDEDIIELKENLREDYFIRAKAAAYIIQNHSKVIGDLEEIRKIASLLQVDELHLFDPEGTLFAGSEPKYYNYTFYSGEQMQFFLPMLNDYSLQLCQEVTPSTAEGKLMQYIAVWREDRQGIIQIGMAPVRLLEAMEKKVNIFAADMETGDVLGTSDEFYIHVPDHETRPVRMSGGYVFYPEYKKDFREKMNLADQAMYQVKKGTKGCFLRYQGCQS